MLTRERDERRRKKKETREREDKSQVYMEEKILCVIDSTVQDAVLDLGGYELLHFQTLQISYRCGEIFIYMIDNIFLHFDP